MIREGIWLAGLIAAEVLDHLRDHIAGALNAHSVPDAKPETSDFVAVVERHIGDDYAAYSYRL
jgi:hypothetical protein